MTDSELLFGQRDRDLELAARIGQSLLQRNHLLQERNEALEEQLAQALDQVASTCSFLSAKVATKTILEMTEISI